MKVKIDQIKNLREKTGVSVLECRQALREAQGKSQKALEILKKKGIVKAGKKAERKTKAGFVEAYTHATGNIGVLVELACETDFVARNKDFRTLAHELCLQVASMKPKDVAELLKQEYIRDNSKTIGDLVKEAIAKLGENIIVKRFTRFEI